jgi:glycosyltransferase involved in cell wall biosynthesis
MNLERNVNFKPAMLIEDLPAALVQADVGLIPNRASAASHMMLPVKLMEYAALGIPIIASNLQTIEHYFGNGAVRLFEAGNPHALASAIEELYRSPGKRREFRLRALNVAASFSWEQQRLRFFDAIDSVLGRRLTMPRRSPGEATGVSRDRTI